MPVNVNDLFAFAASFHGYTVWGGFEPCAGVANHVLDVWERVHQLPESLTLLRSALFFESRRERFVHDGGFGDDPAGYEEHHDYMRELLEGARGAVENGASDAEDQVVADWLETNEPDWTTQEPGPDEDCPAAESPTLDDDQVSAACTLAARLIGVDLHAGVHVDEDRVRSRIVLALRHLAPVTIKTERSVPVVGFRGVGPSTSSAMTSAAPWPGSSRSSGQLTPHATRSSKPPGTPSSSFSPTHLRCIAGSSLVHLRSHGSKPRRPTC